MTKKLITIMAGLALAGSVLAQDHPKGEHPSEHPKATAAAAGILDGKVFAGDLGKAGDKKGDKDTLTFKGGTFVSSACVAYGFHEAPYTATEKDGVVTFSANPKNAKGETMAWTGTIKGGALEATAVNKTPSGDTTYQFNGKLGAATAEKETKKKSEHPEHPK